MTAKRTRPHHHEWVVFSTALAEGCLLVQCVECGAVGTVDDPSEDKWKEAFDAPSKPYGWDDDSRVTIRHADCGRRYVVREKELPTSVAGGKPSSGGQRSSCHCDGPDRQKGMRTGQWPTGGFPRKEIQS